MAVINAIEIGALVDDAEIADVTEVGASGDDDVSLRDAVVVAVVDNDEMVENKVFVDVVVVVVS